MKILKWVGIVVGVLIVLFVVVGLCLPSRYHVERSVVVDAPAEAIYPTISTPKTWPEWTAWTVEKYPDMKIAFSGPDSGKGAKYEWDAEAAGGHGELTLTYSDPAHGVKFDLNMNQGQFVATGGIGLEPGKGTTKVTWWNEGELGWNPINRYCGLMMDGMMGPDLQTGLDNLKAKVEAEGANKNAGGEKPAGTPAAAEAPAAAAANE